MKMYQVFLLIMVLLQRLEGASDSRLNRSDVESILSVTERIILNQQLEIIDRFGYRILTSASCLQIVDLLSERVRLYFPYERDCNAKICFGRQTLEVFVVKFSLHKISKEKIFEEFSRRVQFMLA